MAPWLPGLLLSRLHQHHHYHQRLLCVTRSTFSRLCTPPSGALPAAIAPHQRGRQLSTCAGGGPGVPPVSPLSANGEPLPLAYLQSQIERFDITKGVEEASTPPASWFTSPAFHDLELSSVFTRNWIAVGSTLRLLTPGSYFTGRLGRHSYVVLRDEEGRLRAFYNVCRHHAMCLLPIDHQGCVTSLVCGYHGWTYRLDGRLSKATRISGIKNFSPKDYGLIEIELHKWGHLVFLRFGGRSSMDDNDKKLSTASLSPLLSELEGVGFSQGMRFVKRTSYPIKCNWKVVVDNYLDGGMHVPYAHKALDGNLDTDSYTTTVHDGYSIQACRAASTASDRVGKAALYAHIYPNLMINRYGPWLDVNYAVPLSADRCEVVFEYFLEEETAARYGADTAELDKFVESSLSASDVVQAEDTYLCENVQAGLQSPAYDVGRYAPRVEFADHEFHVRLGKQLRTAVASAATAATPTGQQQQQRQSSPPQ